MIGLITRALEKLKEEVAELVDAMDDPDHREEELGDVLFSLVNICRHYKLNAEDVLRHTNQKFVKRFKLMESLFEGKELQSLSLQEMEAKWQEAKQLLKQNNFNQYSTCFSFLSKENTLKF